MDSTTVAPHHRQSPTEALARRTDEWLNVHGKLCLAAALALCLLTFSGYSHAKTIWVDEVLQMMIAGQPTAGQVANQLRDGYIQVDPPMLHEVQHFLLQWFGQTVQVARLPAIAGFGLMCVSLALLVSRHAPRIYGAAAFFVPYATVLRSRAMDARPYGVLAGFTALTFLCWDRATQGAANRKRWLIGFTLSAAVMFCSHFYSVLFLLPIAMGEAAKLIRRRRFDRGIPVCLGIALIPFVFALPTAISSSKKFMQHYFYRAAFSNLYDFYGFAAATLPFAATLVFLLLAYGAVGGFRREDKNGAVNDRSLPVFAAAAGFLLIPGAGYFAGALVTGFFVPYYHMMSVIGLAVGVPLIVSAMTGRNRLAGLCVLAAMGGHGLFVTARGLTDFRRHDPSYPALAEISALTHDPDPDIVVASPTLFLPWQYTTRDQTGAKLIYLYDPAKALAALGTDTADLLYSYLPRITHARIEPFEPWVASHHRFYIASAGPTKGTQEWQYDYLLKQMHARLLWMGKAGDFDIFQVSPELETEPAH